VANGGLILLAEDDPRLRRIYVDILDAAGFNVLTAGDGVEALRILSKATPRLLILDIMMPNLNGIETCKRARKIIGDDIPIIFLSALDRIDILRPAAMTT
jgi:DNA-binding response OmpR family regulator